MTPSPSISEGEKRRQADLAASNPTHFARLFLEFEPTCYQSKFLEDPAKRIVVKWPRQSGKSTTLAAKAIWFAITNREATVLIVSPCLRQSANLRDIMASLLKRLPGDVEVVSRALRTTIYFRSGTRIVALPANPDTLRGYTAHMVLVDEADFFRDPEAMFHGTVYPMLTTTDGYLIVSSTPWSTKGFFHKICSEDSGYSRHFINWRDAVKAGIAKESVVLEAQRNNPPEIFRREYECEFVEDADVFLPADLIANCVDANLELYPFDVQHRGEFYAGVDLGKHMDYSVVVVAEKTPTHIRVVHLRRFPLETPYASVIGYLKALCDRWRHVVKVAVDQTGVGDPIVEEISRAGLTATVEGFKFTREAKERLAVPVKQAMLTGRVRIPYDRDFIAELNVERYEMSKDGHYIFTHPERSHDDRFWAFMLAATAALSSEGGSPNPLARSI